MPHQRVYLDHNASTPCKPGPRDVFLRATNVTGNPSAIHVDGRAARALVEGAREQAAASVNGVARSVIFMSGATEGLNMLLQPGMNGCKSLIILPTEHAACLEGHRFAAEHVTFCPVDANGVVKLDRLEALLERAREPVMVCIQAANSETGVIQPLAEINRICEAYDAVWICDAVQAMGRVPLDVSAVKYGAVVVSSHKIGGPRGCGAVVLTGPDAVPVPLIRGGGQERALRSGSESMPAIAGFAAAMQEAAETRQSYHARTLALRLQTEAIIRDSVPDAPIFGEGAERLPNTVNFAIPGRLAARTLMAFDLKGVSLSSGSACSSGKVANSRVLAAMGVPEAIAQCALRVSFGWSSTEADVARFTEVLRDICAKPS